MHPMLNTAIKAARRAAAVINRASFDLDRVVVTEKNHKDFVTDVDQAAEQAIIEVLSSLSRPRLPGRGIGRVEERQRRD